MRFTGEMRTMAGQSSLDLALPERSTLSDVMLALREFVSPAFAEKVVEPLIEGCPSASLLLLNRRLHSGAELARPVGEGDVVAFVMPMEGG